MTSTKRVAWLAAFIASACGVAHASPNPRPGAQDAAAPTFDCARVLTPGEQLVCKDPQLARLDVELARLLQLARTSPQLDASRRRELEANQRGWIKGRDECTKATNSRQCVADHYVLRLHELRQNFADARIDGAGGLLKGPFVSRCQGLNELVSTQFVGIEPPMVSLLWLDTYALVLIAGPSGSGTRYARMYDDGEYVFWEKGGEALFQAPGRRDATCRITQPD